MARAKADDPQAIATLFGQFIPPGEQIVETRYMGVMGLWGLGTHSFAAVTPRRVATIRVGLLGAVVYQDAALECLNSSAVFQPSRLRLYLPGVLWMLAVLLFSVPLAQVSIFIPLVAIAVGLLLMPLIVKLSYRFVKSGLVLWIQEGLMVYIFIDRERIILANRYYRLCWELRDERIREVGHP